MRSLMQCVVGALIAFVLNTPVRAEVINVDDLPPVLSGQGWGEMQAGYAGLHLASE